MPSWDLGQVVRLHVKSLLQGLLEVLLDLDQLEVDRLKEFLLTLNRLWQFFESLHDLREELVGAYVVLHEVFVLDKFTQVDHNFVQLLVHLIQDFLDGVVFPQVAQVVVDKVVQLLFEFCRLFDQIYALLKLVRVHLSLPVYLLGGEFVGSELMFVGVESWI